MLTRSQRQQQGQQKKFSFTASTSVLKTCRPSSGLRVTQRELCSVSVASTALQASTSAKISDTKPDYSVFSSEEVHISKRGQRTGRRTPQNFL